MSSFNKLNIKEEKELILLRDAVLKGENLQNINLIKSPQLIKIVKILVKFLQNKQLLCYGGTAINNILPKEDQFYNYDKEIPDFDFYSPNALNDAIELSNIYFKEGFEEVEAKAGVHKGTYKVFVNFISIADITFLPSVIYDKLKKDALIRKKIYYAPIEYLRMSMYLELSRPKGDLSRWEKVLTRLNLLNKHYPLNYQKCKTLKINKKPSNLLKSQQNKIISIIKDSLIQEKVVFLGGFALKQYSKYSSKKYKDIYKKNNNFYGLSMYPYLTIILLSNILKKIGYENVKYKKHEKIEDLLDVHYELFINDISYVIILKPNACHSYNEIILNNKKIKIASMETILSFYLLFIYVNKSYLDSEEILCNADYLYKILQKNRNKKTGILKRFALTCYGEQLTYQKIKEQKSSKYKKLRKNKKGDEFKEWFLRYIPSLKQEKPKLKIQSQKKTKSKSKNKTQSKNK